MILTMNRVLPTAMRDVARLVSEQADSIIDAWVLEVRQNTLSRSAAEITYESVLHRLPQIIKAIASKLTAESSTQPACDDIQIEIGFDPAEMLQEFSTLRKIILSKILVDSAANHTAANRSAAEQSIESRSSELDSALNAALSAIDSVLNEMSARAIKRYAEHQIEQINPAYSELLSSNQTLTRLVKTQKEDASHLAHELKNPLHAIISFASILLRRKEKQSASDPANILETKQLTRILDNGQRLSRLITNMLEVSRNESEERSLHIESVDAAKLIQSVVDSLEGSAQQKGLALTVDCDHAPSQIKTDSLRLQQVLVNLVSNAIRYTDKGCIGISCDTIDEQTWALTVKDTGRGISPDQQASIFSPYFQVGLDADQIAESSGLGLTIVSKLVELLQGEVELVSALGEGSTFKIVLPTEL